VRNPILPHDHYACSWTETTFSSNSEITDLGVRYFSEKDPAKKEEILLELLRRFHPYLMKYLCMITLGKVPNADFRPDGDSVRFLRNYMRRGEKPTPANLARACKYLHLAFKGMSEEDVYSVLVSLFIQSIAKWDPHYANKVSEVVEAIRTKKLDKKEAFDAVSVGRSLGYDPARYLERLCRYGYLERVQGPGGAQRFRVSHLWPPGPEFLNSGPIGLTYLATKCFRYMLHRWINARMQEIEAKQNVFQMEHRKLESGRTADRNGGEVMIPSSLGTPVPGGSRKWHIDTSLMEMQMDLPAINLQWVLDPRSDLFCEISERDRFLLYLKFALERSWASMEQVTSISANEFSKVFQKALLVLRSALHADN